MNLLEKEKMTVSRIYALFPLYFRPENQDRKVKDTCFNDCMLPPDFFIERGLLFVFSTESALLM